MYMPWFPPAKLIARRRSRCWKCDSQMTKRTATVWWCYICRHTVDYGQQRSIKIR